MTRTQIITRINDVFGQLQTDKNGKIELNTVHDALMDAFAAQRAMMPKINDDGMVWCNFHKTYEPAENFDTRTDKNGKIHYKSMCRIGESIKRKIKRITDKIIRELTSRLVMGVIDNTKMGEYMAQMNTWADNHDLDGLTALYDTIRGKTAAGGEK